VTRVLVATDIARSLRSCCNHHLGDVLGCICRLDSRILLLLLLRPIHELSAVLAFNFGVVRDYHLVLVREAARGVASLLRPHP